MVQIVNMGQSLAGKNAELYAQGISKNFQDPQKLAQGRSIADALDLPGGTPKEMAQNLYRAGANESQINMLMPLLMQQEANQRSLQQAGQPSQGQAPVQEPEARIGISESLSGRAPDGAQVTENIVEEAEIPEYKSIVTPASAAILQQTIAPPTQAKIDKLGAELFDKNRSRYGHKFENAREQAEKQLTRDYNTQKAELNAAGRQQELEQNFENEFDKVLGRRLQKSGAETYSDVLGDLQQQFINKGKDAVARGMPPSQAANKYSKEALDFGKQLRSLKDNLGMWNMARTSTGKLKNEIRKGRDTFHKYGLDTEYQNYLTSHANLSPRYAAFVGNPVSNKDIKASIKNLPNKSLQTTPFYAKNNEPQLINKLVESFSENLGKDDSLLAIGVELEGKGYDVDKYVQTVEKLFQDNKIKLSKYQQEELRQPLTKGTSLPDLFFFGFSGTAPKR